LVVCALHDVCKSYRSGFAMRRKVALDGINFEVEAGETFACLGHNGAGKSTTIKALLGLVRIDSGEVRMFGAPAGNRAALRRVGYLPENPYFYDHLSGRELLQLAADLHRLPRPQVGARMDEVLALVGMTDAAGQRLRTYSKGMLQRIGLAQALINDPDLLILDEPMSGLDPVGRHQIRTILGELKQRGKTLFMSSHILYDVEAIADRAAILSGGNLRRIVRLQELPAAARKLEVQCRGLQGDAMAALAARGFTVYRDGYVVRIELEEETQLSLVLAAVRTGGGQLLGVVPQRQTLEEIFLAEAYAAARASQSPAPARPVTGPTAPAITPRVGTARPEQEVRNAGRQEKVIS
jgi:ABC-2 type transport system ATP-binding protein